MKSYITTPVSLEEALSLVDPKALPTAEQIRQEAMRQLLSGQSDRADLKTGDVIAKNDFVRLKVASTLPRFNHDTVGVWLGGGLYDEKLENEIIGKSIGSTGVVTARDVEVKYEVLSGSRPVARVASDELVESLGLEGIHTVEDYVADVAAKINDTVSMNQLGAVWGYVAENAKADVADEDVDVYQAQMRKEMEESLRRKGVDPTEKLPAEFVEIYGTDDFDAYIKGNYENSRGQIQLFLGFCSLVGVEPVGEYDYLENGGAFSAVVQKVQEKISDKLAGEECIMIQKNVTEAQFDQVVSQGVWLAAFCTEHCGPCKMLHKELEEIISYHPDINLAECDVEKDRALGKRFKVFGTPTLLFYNNGVNTGRMVGIDRDTLNEKLSLCLYGE